MEELVVESALNCASSACAADHYVESYSSINDGVLIECFWSV